jgi:hypothetical protein
MVQQAEFHGVTVPYLPAIQIECEAESLLSAYAKRFAAITKAPLTAWRIRNIGVHKFIISGYTLAHKRHT